MNLTIFCNSQTLIKESLNRIPIIYLFCRSKSKKRTYYRKNSSRRNDGENRFDAASYKSFSVKL
jgi:hypothetical protein